MTDTKPACTKPGCPSHGQPHDRCVGHKKWTDPPQPCKKFPINGGFICDSHGANAAVRAKAAERRLTAQIGADAKAILGQRALEGIEDPLDLLARVAAETAAFREAVANRMNALGGQIRYASDQGTEQLRSEVVLYERATDRCIKVLDVLAKSNIEERRLARDERLLDQVEALVRAALTRLALTPAQWEQVPDALEYGLRAIEGGKA